MYLLVAGGLCHLVLESVDFETGYARFQGYTCLIDILVVCDVRSATFYQVIFPVEGIGRMSGFSIIRYIFRFVCQGLCIRYSLGYQLQQP